MSSEYKNINEFGLCQERWHEKSAKQNNKTSLNYRTISFGMSALVTVVLLFDSKLAVIVASCLSWAGSLFSFYIEESKKKERGIQERVVAEKLRILNAQFSSSLISEEEYSNRLISILTNHADKYEELLLKDLSKEK